MNDLTINKVQLPDNIEDLSRFVLVSEERIQSLRAEIRAIKKVHLAKEVYEQKLAEAQEIGQITVEAAQKMGELLLQIQKASGGDRRSDDFKNSPTDNFEKTKKEITSDMGMSPKQVSQYQQMAQNPEAVQLAIQKAIENGDVVSRSQVMKEIKALKEELRRAKEQAKEVPPADYEETKRKADTYEKDFRNMKRLYGEMSEKWKLAEQQKEKLLAQIEEPEAKNEMRIKTDAYSLCAGVGNFLERYGGLVYLMNEIDQLPSKEKKAVMDAVGAMYRWADEMLNAGVEEVVE